MSCRPSHLRWEQMSDSSQTTAEELPCSARASSCDTSEVWEEEGVADCHLVVRGTFFHLDDGQSLMQRYQKLRRAKTDGLLALEDEEEELEAQEPQQSAPAAQQAQAEPEKASKQKCSKRTKERTTVMLRNLPNNYTREMFLEMLDQEGLKGKYDFVYLPCDFHRQANLGYAFVNLVDSEAVDYVWKTFHNFCDWALPSSKVCEVTWSGPHQGFHAHVERYRNSPVMHRSVPEEYKPMIFKNGRRKTFPAPTRKVKAPF